MNRMTIPTGVPERRLTKWHNPLPHPQSVTIGYDGAPFMFVVPPGETRELDSRYDRAVQMVDCGHDECHKAGWFCTKGHEGLIVGGGAPLLRRVGKNDRLDSSLDPESAARKSVEAQVDLEIEREKILEKMRERRSAEMSATAEATAKTPPTTAQPSAGAAPKKG
jgi:hypothetical protein